MRVALVHDYLYKNGGAEKVLQQLHEMFPEASVYTLLYDELGTSGVYKGWDIRTSGLHTKPFIKKAINYYRSVMPQAIESFDLTDYDLVISDSSSFAKGVITQPNTLHISYIHTPTRFLWFDLASHINRGKFGLLKSFVPLALHNLRIWDFLSAKRPDVLVANSTNTQQRIKKFYRRDSVVIHPPVDVARFDHGRRDPQDFFVLIARLEPHKDIDLAIEAANKSKSKLHIIGTGSDEARLRQLAGPTTTFLGHMSDKDVESQLYHAKALLAPQTEDFGITMAESLAAGCPVIARAAGGALEIVENGKTGILISSLTAGSLSNAMLEFKSEHYDPKDCHESVTKFSTDNFKHNITKLVNENLKD